MNAFNLLTGTPPRWAVMWLLAGGLFISGKALVRRRMKRRDAPVWPFWKTAAWYSLWPGMHIADFTPAGPGHSRTVVAALARMAAGAVLLWGFARHLSQPLAAGWCGMIGLILLLHFGVFDLLAIFWQAAGLRATPIMNAPARALSIADFWGRRWNSAFRDLAHPFLFAPAARRWGRAIALWASFAVSGLVHELVISVPAGAGFGLPTGYFLAQALGITIEKIAFPKGGPMPARRAGRWLFTHAFTALPACFLFHPPFVERVMVPFFHTLGALP